MPRLESLARTVYYRPPFPLTVIRQPGKVRDANSTTLRAGNYGKSTYSFIAELSIWSEANPVIL